MQIGSDHPQGIDGKEPALDRFSTPHPASHRLTLTPRATNPDKRHIRLPIQVFDRPITIDPSDAKRRPSKQETFP
jgi:hypothetical protein